jgi:hypothetical protein
MWARVRYRNVGEFDYNVGGATPGNPRFAGNLVAVFDEAQANAFVTAHVAVTLMFPILDI